MARYVRKSSPEALDQALEKLVMISPNKKTYDEMTSLMFQLYCGNDFGLGNFNLSLIKSRGVGGQAEKKLLRQKV